MNIHILPKARQMTQERLKEVLTYHPAYEPITAYPFTWRQQRPGCVPGRIAGTIANGYRQIEIDYKLFRASRLAWLYMTGEWPENLVDHINGKRDDDRWCNLRAATYQENARNKQPGKRNTTGVVGVHPVKRNGQWGAEIGVDGRNVKLGCFECVEDAAAARCQAEKHYFGEFARMVSNG
ncbi:MAG: HNH endonuclease [Hyphomicrobiales bacterium]|nr:HNH endonuclease [Hyphomicrobiales bacterium]